MQELKETTSSIANISRQRDFFAREITRSDEIDDLDIIEEALSAEDSTLSNAASERRMVLTEAAMTARLSQEDKDDMATHADTDLDVRSLLVQEDVPHNSGAGELPLAEGKESRSVVMQYGHQNNLSAIQERDDKQMFVLESKRDVHEY